MLVHVDIAQLTLDVISGDKCPLQLCLQMFFLICIYPLK